MAAKAQGIGATVFMWFWSLIIFILAFNWKPEGKTGQTVLKFATLFAIVMLPTIVTIIRYVEAPVARQPGDKRPGAADSTQGSGTQLGG